ncbi:OmpA family protein [Allorhizocola rhizosphaerae]|uniref:OmpA family protein n=1 Tax=Allorhizocola rhizosphaerae TaxID=1872709 RepID=UPI000E3ED4A8|nr:OmpA family protein [Allorhizocola rhizosphaerae]
MSRRRLWIAATTAAVGLAAIGVAQGIPNRHSIEADLTSRSSAALEAAGVGAAEVKFVGRDGSVVVRDASHVDRARSIVEGVQGVRVVAVTGPQALRRAPSVTVTVDGGRTRVAGVVPSEAAKATLLTTLAAQGELTVDPGVSDTHLADLPDVVRALGTTAKGVTIELRDGRITLAGTVESAAARDAAVAAAGRIAGAANVTSRLEVVAKPPEVVQRALTDLPQITFENNSATLTAEGQAAVAKAADILRDNPTARVRIEGHTDSNGTPESNLSLSQARAQSVRDALVALGIAPDRMTAEGFGESRPRVPDDSPQNQALNRRVEFILL